MSDWNFLVLYAQPHWHSEAGIVGTRMALKALAQSIQGVLDTNQDGECDAMLARDGEGYSISIQIRDEAAQAKMPLPYTDSFAGGVGAESCRVSREEGIAEGRAQAFKEAAEIARAKRDDWARNLHWKMEHLDPTEGPEWEGLTEHEKDFYRIAADWLKADIAAAIEAAAKGQSQ